MKNNTGYSLAELLLCIAIGSILLSTALPPLTATLLHSRATAATNQLLGTMAFARSSAVFQGQVVGLCAGQDQCKQSRNWQDNLLVYIDGNRNGQLDENEYLLRELPLPSGHHWHWSNFRQKPFLQFQPDGTSRALNGTFTLCRAGSPQRQLVLNVSGRSRTQPAPDNARCHD
jgi:type IV fimbrial biogenesis protein FimT